MAACDTAAVKFIPIPPLGDAVPDGYPSIIKGIKYTLAAGSDNVSSDFDGVIAASDGNAAVAKIFAVPSGTIIWDVGWRVATAFNAEVDLSIGDSAGADGYAQVAHVDATLGDGMLLWTSRNTVAQSWFGDSNAAADTTGSPPYGMLLPMIAYNSSTPGADVPINVTLATTAASTGILEVYLWYDMSLLQSKATTT